MARSAHRNIIGVGGVVRMGDGILLVRLTYSDIKGRFMFPGGKVDPGESLEAALVREVEEEAGVVAEPEVLVAVRHRVDAGELNTYLVFSMRHVRGEPRPNGRETDAVAVVDAERLRTQAGQFASLVPAVALPVLEGSAEGLTRQGYLPAHGRYSAETFQLYAAPGSDGD
ncbi:MAG: NUDIX hydrolase [Chloroflexota bacterium]|nr:NUDIX hydrolase [Chloroflexota bacterium]